MERQIETSSEELQFSSRKSMSDPPHPPRRDGSSPPIPNGDCSCAVSHHTPNSSATTGSRSLNPLAVPFCEISPTTSSAYCEISLPVSTVGSEPSSAK